MSGDVKDEVLKWLVGHGYPLEMRAAQLAREAGFDVSQSDYYIDPETEVAREIDLILKIPGSSGPFATDYTLLVECKASQKGKPWVVFSSPNPLLAETDDFKRFMLVNFMARSAAVGTACSDRLLSGMVKRGEWMQLYPRLDVFRVIGYGLAQAFGEGASKETPFKAVLGSIKASIATMKQGERMSADRSFTLAFPVVLVDVPVFTASLSQGTNDIELTEVDIAALHWKPLVAGRSRTGVVVTTLKAFPEFLAKCKQSADWWTNLETSQLENIRQSLVHKRSRDKGPGV